jgi:diadenosine tetraphosphate (Ap4A) HIT family hydrolase
MHVHIHIIPKFPDTGFKMGWNAGKLDDAEAQKLVADIHAALDEQSERPCAGPIIDG